MLMLMRMLMLMVLLCSASPGPGNWAAVAEHVGTKSTDECQHHYHQIYIQPDSFPLPTPAPEMAGVSSRLRLCSYMHQEAVAFGMLAQEGRYQAPLIPCHAALINPVGACTCTLSTARREVAAETATSSSLSLAGRAGPPCTPCMPIY